MGTLLVACGLLLSSVPGAGQSAIEAEFLRLEAVWNDAHRQGDADVLAELWSDDMEIVVPEMPTMTKREALAFARSGRMRFSAYDTSDIRIRAFGDSALVTGRLRRTRNVDGQTQVDDWRFSKVYQRQGSTWRVVLFQASAGG